MERQEYIAKLREIADFFESHPDVPTPSWLGFNVHLASMGEVSKIARQLGSVEKHYSGDMFYIRKQFGEARIDFNVAREVVCRRVVVGTRTVEAVPAYVEDIVEWKCDEPLLAEQD